MAETGERHDSQLAPIPTVREVQREPSCRIGNVNKRLSQHLQNPASPSELRRAAHGESI